MFITRQPTQSREHGESGGGGGNSDSPCGLICHPCEPPGHGFGNVISMSFPHWCVTAVSPQCSGDSPSLHTVPPSAISPTSVAIFLTPGHPLHDPFFFFFGAN